MELNAQVRALVTQTAEEAAEKAVSKTFLLLGIDAAKPLEAQKNFAALTTLREWWEDENSEKDRNHLRFWRTTIETGRSHLGITILGVLATGAVVYFLSRVGIQVPTQ